ncbi:glycoside hydrolase family 31 protein [Melioribacter sp. OK-6-Me]|uniref:glycoside hydrolase family 31 protein n=1 Tax=unclassified Melioribacter TaxID=2627329 RepID=UPI003ED876F7
MNKKYILLFILCLILLAMTLQAESYSFQKTDYGINARIKSIGVEVQFFNSSIIRIIKWPVSTSFDKKSLSVIAQPQKIRFNVNQTDKNLILKSKDVQVLVNLNNGQISFLNTAGALLLNEKENGFSFTAFNDAGNQTYSVSQFFVLDQDEAIYGLGQQQQGKMVQRNIKLRMIQGNTDDYIPFFLSVKGYGLFWDNYSPTIFTDTPEETSFSSDVGDCIDYYFMYGGNADGVIAQMRGLTGRVPMFPLWTFGYWQSKERYKSQDEIVGVVKKYRELGVPLDGIIQDWQYWGNNYLWNAMEFLNAEFYDPQKMVDDIHALNAHIIISIWNSFGPMTKQYKELDSLHALMDFKTWPESGSDKWPPRLDYPSGVRVYDAYHPQAREIYWKYLKNGLFSLGIDGWWIDSSEPDHLQFKESDLDNKTYPGSFRKVRNAYPLMTVGGVYEHQRQETSNKRVFILTRSAFAGQQRFGSVVWSGDVVASWEALRNQISAGLNFSLCGIPYWNSDIGGFFLWNFPDKLNDPEYKELYVRWLQFGAFCPMMRSHGTDAPREIYQFGKKGEPIYDAIEKFINLRYRLLPYIYSTAWDVTANHSTMMRALVMDFPHDKNALDLNDEYMFGKSLLVCPVTENMYNKNKKEDFGTIGKRTLYLPEGTNWYDFWTGEKFTGGQYISRDTPIDIIPLYVKAGSILPIGPKVQYATEKKWDNLEIRIYEGADGEFTLYEDEGDNYNYEKKLYSTIIFKWNNKSKALTISEQKGSFPGMLTMRNFRVVVVSKGHGIGIDETEFIDKMVKYNGKEKKVVF